MDGYLRVATTIRNRWLLDGILRTDAPKGGSNAGKPGTVGRPEVNSTRRERGIVNETGMVGGPGVNSMPPVSSTVVGGNTGSVGCPRLRALIDEPKIDERFELVAECSNLTEACMDENAVST